MKFDSINAHARSVPNKRRDEILLLAGHKEGPTSRDARENSCATATRKHSTDENSQLEALSRSRKMKSSKNLFVSGIV
ncbi:hypothetical protein [Bradyrhizobium sp. AZCC 2289]|uniref:hypothetical protein n=1 Tax=Bradyrhizobium sp. AZCC 2289 TaxID=3117026 RepID=UPI002FF2A7A2